MPGRIDPKRVFFCVLIILAVWTRFWQLDTLPYGHNNDETGLTYEGYLLLQESGLPVFVSQAREPTLPYLYGLLVELFGFSNGVIRLPSALFGVIGCMSLCLLIFRFVPDYWAFCISMVVISYGPNITLDRLALRTSVCTAVVFVFLFLFFRYRSSERRLHWFVLGVVFGLGFHTYHAYRVMPAVVVILLVVHFWDATERRRLGRKLLFFTCGAAAGGWILVYTLLKHGTEYVFFKESSIFQNAVLSDAGFGGTLGRNLVVLCRMLLGREVPLPVGAEVPFFHAAWVPLLAFGIWCAVRARWRQPPFAILITFVVFLAPVLLSNEVVARRYLTSLVLAVVLAGYGAYEVFRRLSWDGKPSVRAAALVLAIGVASWNLWCYFGAYASRPKWDQGPFSAAHRWVGTALRDVMGEDSKILMANEIDDPWMLELYLIGIVDINRKYPAVMRMRIEYDDISYRQIESFCRTPRPIYFLSKIDTPEHISGLVQRACDTTRLLPIEWPADIVAGDDMKIVVATRPEF